MAVYNSLYRCVRHFKWTISGLESNAGDGITFGVLPQQGNILQMTGITRLSEQKGKQFANRLRNSYETVKGPFSPFVLLLTAIRLLLSYFPAVFCCCVRCCYVSRCWCCCCCVAVFILRLQQLFKMLFLNHHSRESKL